MALFFVFLILGLFFLLLGFYLLKKFKEKEGEYLWLGEEKDF